MPSFAVVLHRHTPSVAVLSNRNHAVREIRYHRYPDASNMTDERITRHQYDVRGYLVSSIDPRLYEAMQQTGAKVKPNFHYHSALSGDVLKTESVDAGTTCLIKDSLGRSVIGRNAEGTIIRWHYEPEGTGRLLSITEKATNLGEKVLERFVYAKDTPGNRANNLVGHLIAHYDSVGG